MWNNFTSVYAREKPQRQSLPPLDLKSAQANRIIKDGIYSPDDIEIAFRYIQTIAPEFGGELVKAYQAYAQNITFEINMDLQEQGTGGTTAKRPISYFNRDAEYPTTIELMAGADIYILAHELIHALPRRLHPEILKKTLFPVMSTDATVREMMEQAKVTFFQEEAFAFSSMFILADEADRNGYQARNISMGASDEGLRKYFKAGGGAKGNGILAVREAIPHLYDSYAEQIKVLGAAITLAGKTGRADDPAFDLEKILKLGKENPQEAATFLYRLFKDVFPKQNTVEALIGIVRRVKEADDKKQVFADTLIEAMEARFDGKKSTLNLGDLTKKYKSAAALGARSAAVDQSHDQGHMRDPEMAKLAISGWSSYLQFLDKLKESDDVDGRRFAQIQLHLAESATDPIAGRIFGQVRTLAYAQADDVPEMLIDLALSLQKAGYVGEARQAMLDFVDIAVKPVGSLLVDPGSSNPAVREYLEAVEKFPISDQPKLITALLQASDFYKMPKELLKYSFSFKNIFKKFDQFTEEEFAAIQEIFRDYPNLDRGKIEALYDRVVARAGVNRKFMEHQQRTPPSLRITKPKDDFRNSLIHIFVWGSKQYIEITDKIHGMEQKWSSNDPETIVAREELAKLDRPVRKLANLDNSQSPDWKKKYKSLDQLTTDIRKHDFFGPNSTSLVDRRARYTLGETQLVFEYLGSDYYFDLGLSLAEKMPDLPEKLDQLASHADQIIEHLSPTNKIRYLQAVQNCARAVAQREIDRPGLTRWEMIEGQLSPENARKMLEDVKKENLHILVPEKAEETWLYNNVVQHLIEISLKDEDLEVKKFAREQLKGLLKENAYAHYSGQREPFWDLSIDLKFSSHNIGPQSKQLRNQYQPSYEYFTFLTKMVSSLDAFSPEDEPMLKDFFASLYRFRFSDPNHFGAEAQAILNLPLKLIRAGFDEMAEEGKALSHLYREHGFMKASLSSLEGVQINEAIQNYEHVQRYFEWRDLKEKGDAATLQQKTDQFLGDLHRDLEGRARYTAHELTNFAALVGRFPDLHETSEAILKEAVLRYAKQWGVSDLEYYEESHWKTAHGDDLKFFTRTVIDLNIPDAAKDELFTLLIEKMTGVFLQQGVWSLETIRMAMGLKEYLGSHRYPKTDQLLYSRALQLLSLYSAKQNEIKSEDALTVAAYFKPFLEENPWLEDPSHQPYLAQHFPNDKVYQRTLALIYPQAAQAVGESVLLSDGRLNLESTATGFVDLEKFEKALYEKMKSGNLKGEDLSRAVSALLQGSIIHTSKRVRGSLEQIYAGLPVFARIWDCAQVTLNSPAEKEMGESILIGIIEGMAGDSLSDRVLLYADLLQDQKLPIEVKKKIWMTLQKGHQLSDFLKQYLERYILKPQSGRPIQEGEFYEAIGKLIKLNEGKLPRPEAVALLMTRFGERDKYFKAYEKWAAFHKKQPNQYTVDLSDFFDLYFYELFARADGQQSTPSISSIDAQLMEQRYKSKKVRKLDGNIEIKFIASDPESLLIAMINDSDQRYQETKFDFEVKKLQSYAEIEGVELPKFIEEYPIELRQLFSAVIKQLPAGTKSDLQEKIKALEATGNRGKILAELFNTLGWAKIGQLLSVSPLVPPDVKKELSGLQDEVPSSTREEIEKVLRRELGNFYSQIAEIEMPPVKSGSIGEVVKAKLEDGRIVAIKIITDERRRFIERMLKQQSEAISLLRKAGIQTIRGVDVLDFFRQWFSMIEQESNLRLERFWTNTLARRWTDMRLPKVVEKTYFLRDSKTHVAEPPEGATVFKNDRMGDAVSSAGSDSTMQSLPEVQSSSEAAKVQAIEKEVPKSNSVLILEWIEGDKLSPAALTEPALHGRIKGKLIEMLGKPFQTGMFQGDPHPGNFLITPDGELVVLDLGQVEQVNEKDLDSIINLWRILSTDTPDKIKKVVDAVIEMSSFAPPASDEKQDDKDEETFKKKYRQQLTEKVRELLGSKTEKGTAQLLLELNSIANQNAFRTGDLITKLLKFYATLEGVLLELDPNFKLADNLEKVVFDYVEKRFGKAQLAIYSTFGKLPVYRRDVFKKDFSNLLDEYCKEMKIKKPTRLQIAKTYAIKATNQILLGGQGVIVGGIPYGVGEVGSNLIVSLFKRQHFPDASELLGDYLPISIVGGASRAAIDGMLNTVDGRPIFAPVKVPKGPSWRGFARKAIPLALATVVHDWVVGKPPTLTQVSLGLGNVGLASGATHLIGANVRKIKYVEKIGKALKLIGVGSTAGAPGSGGVTFLGACLASIVEFTIIKGLGAVEEKIADSYNRGEVQKLYTQAVRKSNELLKRIREKGIASVSAGEVFEVRKDLAIAKQTYVHWLNSKKQAIESERESFRKEIEEDRREAFRGDRDGWSVASIHKIYDKKLDDLYREYSDKIGEIEGSDSLVEYWKIPTANEQFFGNEQIMSIDPRAKKEASQVQKIPGTTNRGSLFSTEIQLAENLSGFEAQHEMYEEEVKKILEESLKEKFDEKGESVINFV